MGYVKERVAYLKGLAEGMKIDDSTNEGKLLKEMIEVLDDIANSVVDVEEVQDHLGDQVDNIDEDLAEIERILYDDYEYEYEDEDGLVAEIECPHCHSTVQLTEEMLDNEEDSFKCTDCGKDIVVEWDCDCKECNDEEDKK
ncbi:hypothetical protein RBH29_02455 [Herbivorax sp. ANBcel31]|uniref:CD1247 N-terminal domain-containing protein n=1 Tax=Herbivorax sp. ANBcel31 TaxID=3069754 RepID=UPI0027B3E340|nr:CD1247 N-terminal domain-containing protein [Herbivorax sp. ANBcel31]MDQ2085298.1 hypothetical protein [Herbivorax sp. ANBcel31]